MSTRQPRYLGADYEDAELYDLPSWDLPGLTRKPTVNRRQPCKQDRRPTR